ncbi:hypothetical protein EBU94_01920 [bacterium]|nr:hypothetical protein [bacterium]
MTTITAYDIDKNVIGIEQATKSNIYTCKDCDTRLIPVLNCSCIKHFRHQSTKECVYRRREMSEWHINWQMKFIPEFREISFKDENNKIINRADIYTGKYVIEIQHSNISQDEIEKRKNTYGENLIWILDATTGEQEKKIMNVFNRINTRNVFLDTGKDLKIKCNNIFVNISYNEFFINFNLENNLVSPLINRDDIIFNRLNDNVTLAKDTIDSYYFREQVKKEIKLEIENELAEEFKLEIKEKYRPCLNCYRYIILKTEKSFKTYCLDCYKKINGNGSFQKRND